MMDGYFVIDTICAIEVMYFLVQLFLRRRKQIKYGG